MAKPRTRVVRATKRDELTQRHATRPQPRRTGTRAGAIRAALSEY